MFTKPISGVELIEIKTTAVQNKYYFDDYARLRNKIIHGLEIRASSDISYSPSNRVNSNLTGAYVVLVSKGQEVINRIKYNYLNRNYFTPDINLVVDWSKSYIEFSTTSYLATDKSIIVTVYTIDKIKTPVINSLKGEFVKCVINDVNETRFNFKENKTLKDKRIKYITFINSDSPDGETAAGSTIVSKAFLTLSVGNSEKISNLPIPILLETSSTQKILIFDDLIVDWEKSYIKVPNVTSLVANTVFTFNVYYEDEKPRTIATDRRV